MRTLVSCLALIAVLTGCGPETADEGREQSPQFTIVASHLGPERVFSDLGVRLKPPVDWEPVGSEVLARAVQQAPDGAETDGPVVTVVPAAAFIDPGTGNSLIVSRIRTTDSADEQDPRPPKDDELSAYTSELARALDGDGVSTASYGLNGLSVFQIRTSNEQTLTFILMITDDQGRTVQLDYILPLPTEEAELRRIQSSIGTVRPVG